MVQNQKTMIKKIIVTALVLNCLISFGQEAWLDSLAIYTEAQAKLDSIDKWQQQVEMARQKKDVDTELLGLYKILDTKVFDFGNTQRYDEYEEVVLLEALIEQYPNNVVTLKIKAGSYYVLGKYFNNQRIAKNYTEGILDDVLAKKAIENFEKAQEVALKNTDWYVYYHAKILLDANLKGYSPDQLIPQYLTLEKEIKQKKAYEVLSRLYQGFSFQYRIKGDYEKAIAYAKKAISKNLRKRRLNQLLNNTACCLLYTSPSPRD